MNLIWNNKILFCLLLLFSVAPNILNAQDIIINQRQIDLESIIKMDDRQKLNREENKSYKKGIKLLNKAQILKEEKDYKQANQVGEQSYFYFQEVLKTTSDNLIVNFICGDVNYYFTKDFDKAILYYGRVIAIALDIEQQLVRNNKATYSNSEILNEVIKKAKNKKLSTETRSGISEGENTSRYINDNSSNPTKTDNNAIIDELPEVKLLNDPNNKEIETESLAKYSNSAYNDVIKTPEEVTKLMEGFIIFGGTTETEKVEFLQNYVKDNYLKDKPKFSNKHDKDEIISMNSQWEKNENALNSYHQNEFVKAQNTYLNSGEEYNENKRRYTETEKLKSNYERSIKAKQEYIEGERKQIGYYKQSKSRSLAAQLLVLDDIKKSILLIGRVNKDLEDPFNIEGFLQAEMQKKALEEMVGYKISEELNLSEDDICVIKSKELKGKTEIGSKYPTDIDLSFSDGVYRYEILRINCYPFVKPHVENPNAESSSYRNKIELDLYQYDQSGRNLEDLNTGENTLISDHHFNDQIKRYLENESEYILVLNAENEIRFNELLKDYKKSATYWDNKINDAETKITNEEQLIQRLKADLDKTEFRIQELEKEINLSYQKYKKDGEQYKNLYSKKIKYNHFYRMGSATEGGLGPADKFYENAGYIFKNVKKDCEYDLSYTVFQQINSEDDLLNWESCQIVTKPNINRFKIISQDYYLAGKDFYFEVALNIAFELEFVRDQNYSEAIFMPEDFEINQNDDTLIKVATNESINENTYFNPSLEVNWKTLNSNPTTKRIFSSENYSPWRLPNKEQLITILNQPTFKNVFSFPEERGFARFLSNETKIDMNFDQKCVSILIEDSNYSNPIERLMGDGEEVYIILVK